MCRLFHPHFTAIFMNKGLESISYGIYAGLITQYVDYKRSMGFKMEDIEIRLT
jgi:hypothetical protein